MELDQHCRVPQLQWSELHPPHGENHGSQVQDGLANLRRLNMSRKRHSEPPDAAYVLLWLVGLSITLHSSALGQGPDKFNSVFERGQITYEDTTI